MDESWAAARSQSHESVSRSRSEVEVGDVWDFCRPVGVGS